MRLTVGSRGDEHAMCSSRPAVADLCAALMTVASGGVRAEPIHYSSASMAKLELPFSEAVIVGDLLFLSGQLGNKRGEAELVPGGIESETRQAMDHIGVVLEANGSSFDNVIKCTIMLADMADWPSFNRVYAGYFEPPYPARSAFAGAGLVFGARVEIECIARR